MVGFLNFISIFGFFLSTSSICFFNILPPRLPDMIVTIFQATKFISSIISKVAYYVSVIQAVFNDHNELI